MQAHVPAVHFNVMVHNYPIASVAPRGYFQFPIGKAFPESNPSFKGRERILEALHRRFQGAGISVLSGLTGSGTSAIALRYMHLHKSKYVYCFYFDVRNRDSLYAQFRQFAGPEGLNLFDSVSDMSDEAVRCHVKSFIEGLASCLVIYDNASTQEALKDFIPVGENIKLILTSNRNSWQREWLLPVDGLTLEEAQSLAASFFPSGRLSEEVLNALINRSDRLPAALLQHLHYYTTTGCERGSLRSIFEKEMPPPHPKENTWVKMSAVLCRQNLMGREILRCLARGDRPCTEAILQEVMGVVLVRDPQRFKDFRDALAELKRHYLVAVNARGEIEMPRILAEIMAECTEEILSASTSVISVTAHSASASSAGVEAIHYSLPELMRRRARESGTREIRVPGDLVYREGSGLSLTADLSALPEIAAAASGIVAGMAEAGITPPGPFARLLQAGGTLTVVGGSMLELTIVDSRETAPELK